MKKILIGLGVAFLLLVVVVFGGIAYLSTKVNEIVRVGTEKALTYVLEVPCTVGEAKVEVKKGRVAINSITIPNPAGYKGSHAIKFGGIVVVADITSFKTQEPKILQVLVLDSDIVLEKSATSSNLQDLMKSAGRFSKPADGQAEPPKDDSGKKMVIEEVLIKGTKVGVVLPLVGGDPISVTIPDIEMKNIGGDEKKVTPAEALQRIIAEILGSIKNAGAGLLPTDLLNGIGDSLGNLPGELKNTLNSVTGTAGKAAEDAAKTVTDTAGKATEAVGGAVKDVTGSIGGLLGGKKKEAAPEEKK